MSAIDRLRRCWARTNAHLDRLADPTPLPGEQTRADTFGDVDLGTGRPGADPEWVDDLPAWAPPAPPLAQARWGRMQGELHAELEDDEALHRWLRDGAQ